MIKRIPGRKICRLVQTVRCAMDDKDVEIIRAMAELDMNVSGVSRALYMHRNTVIYHLQRIKAKNGLDPQRFCDLVELVGMAGRMEQEE